MDLYLYSFFTTKLRITPIPKDWSHSKTLRCPLLRTRTHRRTVECNSGNSRIQEAHDWRHWRVVWTQEGNGEKCGVHTQEHRTAATGRWDWRCNGEVIKYLQAGYDGARTVHKLSSALSTDTWGIRTVTTRCSIRQAQHGKTTERYLWMTSANQYTGAKKGCERTVHVVWKRGWEGRAKEVREGAQERSKVIKGRPTGALPPGPAEIPVQRAQKYRRQKIRMSFIDSVFKVAGNRRERGAGMAWGRVEFAAVVQIIHDRVVL